MNNYVLSRDFKQFTFSWFFAETNINMGRVTVIFLVVCLIAALLHERWVVCLLNMSVWWRHHPENIGQGKILDRRIREEFQFGKTQNTDHEGVFRLTKGPEISYTRLKMTKFSCWLYNWNRSYNDHFFMTRDRVDIRRNERDLKSTRHLAGLD